ncbi:MAG: hypothetical protein HYU97_09125 [Deltaproteobacteria bacterium]|nr:hypothetical protein [Deltaproteobacteria bacterium]
MVDPICRSSPDSSVNPQSEIAGATNLARILRDTGLPGLDEMAHPWLALVISSYTAYLNAPTAGGAAKQLGEFSKNLDNLDLTKPAYKGVLRNMRNLLASEIRHPQNCGRVDALLKVINEKLSEAGGGAPPNPVVGQGDRFLTVWYLDGQIGGGAESRGGYFIGGLEVGLFILPQGKVGPGVTYNYLVKSDEDFEDEELSFSFAKPSVVFKLVDERSSPDQMGVGVFLQGGVPLGSISYSTPDSLDSAGKDGKNFVYGLSCDLSLAFLSSGEEGSAGMGMNMVGVGLSLFHVPAGPMSGVYTDFHLSIDLGLILFGVLAGLAQGGLSGYSPSL